ncbi:BQ5605_C037g11635 [Microbotryum silenes-dioicae]|uniref:BQ5605_C037g11635 protein n=1 Tax=Microbotryum silenes-dioicae TaxID=796604 RepID=A0A2X0N1X1_9BASI|nr:BQ5605_C037g11635 [Microbotryum silenes-dioicae]
MFRRSTNPSSRSYPYNEGPFQSPQNSVSRASTVSGSSRGAAVGSNNPYTAAATSNTRSGNGTFPELAALSLNDDTPPPPTYQTAVNQGFRQSQELERHHPPPPPQLAPRTPASASSNTGGTQAHRPTYGSPTSQQYTEHIRAPSIASLDRRSSLGSVADSPSTLAQPSTTTGSLVHPSRVASTSAPNRRSSIEDPLAPLGKYDLCILLDDSPSMTEHWYEARDALIGVAERFVRYDKDGIDLCFMNNDNLNLKNVVDASTVREAFENIQPFGSTPTAMVLDDILRDVVDRIEDAKAGKGPKIKPLICIVLTDGRADDTDGLRDLLVEMASRLDEVRAPPFQLGVTFLQIGSDPDATQFLQQLDDDLKAESGVRDIVDTLTYQGQLTPEFVLKAALGSVNKRLDG